MGAGGAETSPRGNGVEDSTRVCGRSGKLEVRSGLLGRVDGTICPSQDLFWDVEVIPVAPCGARRGGTGCDWDTLVEY